ncbi:phosphotyrosine-specific ptp2-like protein [Basidiobolus ranarum]|uniref:protein-tyrosine-phosphatase n=1 Tax=Basidiobolus ranarum TaxID=34480 RepID=A0ABR2WX07_9FUNG
MSSKFSFKSMPEANSYFSLPSDSPITHTSQRVNNGVHNGSQPNSPNGSTVGSLNTNGVTFDPSSFAFKMPFQRGNPKISSSIRKQPTTNGQAPVNNLSLKSFSTDFIADVLFSTHKDGPREDSLLLIDVRSFAQYSRGRIKKAINVCIPNTLLKRDSFNLDKISSSLAENDRETWRRWSSFSYIVIYGVDTDVVLDTSPIYYLIKKFQVANAALNIGWMKDGFENFQKRHPGLCESSDGSKSPLPRIKALPSPSSFLSVPLTCPTPMIESMASPFFNSIRPHHEITCELGEIVAVRTPNIAQSLISKLPPFLIDIAYSPDGKNTISKLFQKMDRIEQKRLQSLMVTQVRNLSQPNPYCIAAGIEKGSKNRYNNIWPYEHSRVKLQNVKMNESDYINASFIRAKESVNSYIATQAPLPATFGDFWKMIWEQNTRVIIMLTKEEEAGRVKCHRYWPTFPDQIMSVGEYFQIRLAGETMPVEAESTIMARRFLLTHTGTQEMREIFQLHFVGWPDFGIPDSPVSVLRLRDLANKLQTDHNYGPMLVHCSAGCGRTGAFCTIDTVIASCERNLESSEDYVVRVVDQLRDQRLSMVQTLRQFVFCYEAMLWRILGVPECFELVPSIDFDHPKGNFAHFVQASTNIKTPGPSLVSTSANINSASSNSKFELKLPAMSPAPTPYFTPLGTTSALSLDDARRDSYF